MKASILVLACLAATPAFAHGAGPRAGGFFHGGHGHRILTPGALLYGQGSGQVIEPAAEAEPPAAQLAPAPFCPTILPAVATRRSVGPHIFYIGHRPDIHGPRIIYGTD